MQPRSDIHRKSLLRLKQAAMFTRAEDFMKCPRLLFHYGSQLTLCRQVLDAVERVDPNLLVKRDWDSVIEHLDVAPVNSTELVVDLLDKGIDGLGHLQEIWTLRVLHNHSAVPLYFALSCSEQPASLRYEIRRLGGYFMYVSDISRHLVPQMEEIRLQLNELQRSVPRWEIVEEHYGSDPLRVSVFFRFAGKLIQIGGSDRHLAVLAVLLKNNGIPRSMRALQQLCSEDPLFEPAGGPFRLPRLPTLKMHLFRDFPKHFQKAFDGARAGYCASTIIEHVDLGAKAMGFRIRGISTVTVR